MKNNIKIASILCGIALICALLIASFNMLTSEIIKENSEKTELQTIQAIYSDYDSSKSVVLPEATDSSITKIVEAKDSSSNLLGYVYTVSGTNAYGKITLMVAVKNDKVIQVEFLENTQSFASTVVAHVQASYPCSAENVIYIGIKPSETTKIGELSSAEVNSIDTSCGATYGANLVKELVLKCLNDESRGA